MFRASAHSKDVTKVSPRHSSTRPMSLFKKIFQCIDFIRLYLHCTGTALKKKGPPERCSGGPKLFLLGVVALLHVAAQRGNDMLLRVPLTMLIATELHAHQPPLALPALPLHFQVLEVGSGLRDGL